VLEPKVLEPVVTTGTRLPPSATVHRYNMASRKPLDEIFHFDEQGTLPPPGPIGRLVRLVMGVLITKLVYDWIAIIDSSDFNQPFILLWVALSAVLVPYVINIGYGIKRGARPRYTLFGIWMLAAITGYLLEGVLRSEALWFVIGLTQIYIWGHLGISFLLSAVLSTPGCEMRAIPHLAGKISGKGSQEHYCPGFIDNVDRWEKNRVEKRASDG